MLHVTNGDAAATRLGDAALPGRVAVWADVLHDGPAIDGLSDDEWHDLRAGFLAQAGYAKNEETARAQLEAWDRSLADGQDEDEVVLWFEHDLFDQLLLVRHLAWFGRQDRQAGRLSLVCIDRHPDVPGFAGLGQLSPAQLAGLFPARSAVSEAQKELGRRAWAAFTSPDPTAIERLLATDTSPQPFLAGALVRHLEEFPSARNGLPRTEQQALGALARGPRTGAELFRAVQRTEERIYMGDLSFFARLRGLATGGSPLIESVTLPQALTGFGETAWRLSPLGQQVAAGRADWIHWNGIDRWLGGVHLRGHDAAWRWDAAARRLRNAVERPLR
jgi:hypothetical protein